MRFLKNTRSVIMWASLIFILLASVVFVLYSSAKTQLHNEALLKYQDTVSHEITRLLDSSRETSMAIALSLSENRLVQEFLKQDFDSTAPQTTINLSRLLEKITLQTSYRDLWVQVLDAKGVSRYRSWTNKVGDSLVDVRTDVREMIRTPQVLKSLSVGKFNLTFKSMVPLFDDKSRFIGVVEIVSQLTPLSYKLKNQQGISSVLMVDKRYQGQLTKANKGYFVEGYYIANSDVDWNDAQQLKPFVADQFNQINPVKIVNNHVITKRIIHDDKGLSLGYWFTFQNADMLNLMEVEQLKRQYLVGSIALLTLTLFILLLYMFKRSADKSLRYYQHVLDSASEIIFVSNYERIIEANQQFFEFYSEFTDIEQFLKKYHCVCDTFLADEEYLQKEQFGEYWLDYVLHHPDMRHKAKIEKNGKQHYFEVKVALISIYDKPLYSVIMHDITSEEEYRLKLEYLSETDTLTGIANRLVFNRTLSKEIQRAHRYHLDLSLMIFDVDHFKKINDNYGHEVGDKVLIALGEVISALLRETDVFCRIGGEEFTIIMPETNLEQAYKTAERLRLAIEKLPDNDLPTQLTISFGVADMTRWDNDKTLLKRADKALYRAKENGRNRVEIAEHHDTKELSNKPLAS